jgi:hypothetical protein
VVISSASNLITYNYFHDCWATSLDYTYDGGGVELFGGQADNNIIMYNTFYNNNGELEHGANNGGLIENTLIAYNKFINSGSFLLVQIVANLFTVGVRNIRIYNNVIIQNQINRTQSSAMLRLRANDTTSNQFVLKNNIILVTTGIPWTRTNGQLSGSQINRSNNIYLMTGSAIGYTINGTEVTNPSGAMFEGQTGPALNWNYTPAVGSRAIDFGTSVGLTQDFIGKAIQGLPDAGIIERTGTVQQPFRSLLKFVQ